MSSSLLYSSPSFSNDQTKTIEQCLSSSTNNQYTITLFDFWGDFYQEEGEEEKEQEEKAEEDLDFMEFSKKWTN